MGHGGVQERRELTKQFSDRSNYEGPPEDRELPVGGAPQNGGLAAKGKPPLNRSTTHTTLSRFMPTSRRIVQFSDGIPAPPHARIVYIDGAFDMFHPAHVEILKVRRPQHPMRHHSVCYDTAVVPVSQSPARSCPLGRVGSSPAPSSAPHSFAMSSSGSLISTVQLAED